MAPLELPCQHKSLMGPAAQIQSPFHTQCSIINAACGTSPLEFTIIFQLFCNAVFSYTALHPHAQFNISWPSCLKLPIKARETQSPPMDLYNSILSEDTKTYWMGMTDFYQTEMQTTLITVIQLCRNIGIR